MESHDETSAAMPTIAPIATNAVDFCRTCGRRHRGNDAAVYRTVPDDCWRCRWRNDRRIKWNVARGGELIDLCAEIGVYEHFIRDNRPPSLNDEGVECQPDTLRHHFLNLGGMLLSGPVGSHKTHLLCARAIMVSRRGLNVQVISWDRLLLTIRSTYCPGAKDTELDVIERFSQLDYLALDDMGTGEPDSSESPASKRTALLLLDTRHARNLTTDIATNCLPDELYKRFGDQVARRIKALTTPYVMTLEHEERT